MGTKCCEHVPSTRQCLKSICPMARSWHLIPKTAQENNCFLQSTFTPIVPSKSAAAKQTMMKLGYPLSPQNFASVLYQFSIKTTERCGCLLAPAKLIHGVGLKCVVDDNLHCLRYVHTNDSSRKSGKGASIVKRVDAGVPKVLGHPHICLKIVVQLGLLKRTSHLPFCKYWKCWPVGQKVTRQLAQ